MSLCASVVQMMTKARLSSDVVKILTIVPDALATSFLLVVPSDASVIIVKILPDKDQ